MEPTEYLAPDPLWDLPEDQVVITWSIESADGMELWGGTFERGPFDDNAYLRAEIAAAIPLKQVEPSRCRGRYAIQLRLF